jgi:carbon storage regulator
VLVFTRKLDQAVVIGDGVEVTVLRVGKDSVRLGVTAPRHIKVHRAEVYEAIRRTNASAAADSTTLTTIVTRLRHDTAPR